MRKYLRRICRAQGIQWPGLGYKQNRKRPPNRGAKSLHERVQKAVKPERWLGPIGPRKGYRLIPELLGVWRDVG
jgi:hypothetical protein